MNRLNIPAELLSAIGTEKVDFSVVAKRKHPLRKSISIIVFALIWSSILVICSITFFNSVLRDKENNPTSNDAPVTVGGNIFIPMLFGVGLFLLIGLGMLSWGLYSLIQKGGYFVGTSNRLISYRSGNLSYYGWDQFSGTIEANTNSGDIRLQLKTGKFIRNDDYGQEFMPDNIYISGITDVLEIEKKCRQRIAEKQSHNLFKEL